MYTVKNSFEFSKKIADQDPGLFFASPDVDSLFTHITLEETKSAWCDSLFNNDAKVNNISKIDFEKTLRAALQNNLFYFKGKSIKKLMGLILDLL